VKKDDAHSGRQARLQTGECMAIRAIVFDIGGVLEITPPTGWIEKWEVLLGFQAGQLGEKLGDVWRCGSLGTLSLSEVEQRIGDILSIDHAHVAAFMDDLWLEYLGQPNDELITYFAQLRPRYKTAILSNSFVGAREKEQERYQFGDICDMLIYSHEEGMEKPEQRFFALLCERLDVQPDEIIFSRRCGGARACCTRIRYPEYCISKHCAGNCRY
jgi:FMN phosphatase YigB (HAD superfamily)